jgi:NAD(P)H-dependent FMN reductase
VPLKLHIIIASTRPGRVGPAVAKWFHAVAAEHGKFDASLIDLAAFNLPLYNEPKHPRLNQYEHAHTKAWSESVKAADAFVIVTPEYNHSPPPALVNALNYVYSEWNYKPAAFVSYGGVSGGLRGVQIVKQILISLKMVPIVEGVVVPMVPQHIDKDGNFKPTDINTTAAKDLLNELVRWADALKPLRAPAAR